MSSDLMSFPFHLVVPGFLPAGCSDQAEYEDCVGCYSWGCVILVPIGLPRV
jgi:hypothetical protein